MKTINPKPLSKYTHSEKFIFDAFLDLLKNREYRKITVSEIAEKALINRVTFYRHFKNKKILFHAIVSSILKDTTFKMGSIERWDKETINNQLEIFFTDLREKKPYLKILFNSDISESVRRQLKSEIQEFFRKERLVYYPGNIPKFKLNYISKIITEMLFRIIEYIVSNDDPEKIMKMENFWKEFAPKGAEGLVKNKSEEYISQFPDFLR